MDSLDAFEKALAAENSERDHNSQGKAERNEHKNRRYRRRENSRSHSTDHDRHSHHHRRHRQDVHHDQVPKNKRVRYEDKNDVHRQHRDPHRDRPKNLKASDPKEDHACLDEEMAPDEEPLVRDAWMTAPSEMDIEHVRRPAKIQSPPRSRLAPKCVLHERELNVAIGKDKDSVKATEAGRLVRRDPCYTFGDQGSQWRMTRLKATYNIAEQTGRSVDDVALERFGSLEDFDNAREEKIEMERRRVYGERFAGKEKPTGELYRQRLNKEASQPTEETASPISCEPLDQGTAMEEAGPRLDRTALNRLRARLIKAKMRKAQDVDGLERSYKAAMAAFESSSRTDEAIVLDASQNRMLAGSSRWEVRPVDKQRGRERGQVEANDDMSIDDMVREERRTRGQAGGEGLRLAERIAKDTFFDNDLEYLDDNAAWLAKRVHKSDAALKNVAVAEYAKMKHVLESCPLCHHEDRNPPHDQPLAPVVALGTRTFLTLATEPELTGAEGGAVIAPLVHHTNLLECDDDEWEEVRNFMKSLIRLYHHQGRDVIFYENAAVPRKRRHAALVAVPIPYALGETAPAFFREAMFLADKKWTQHTKVIDTGKKATEGMGRAAFRRSIAKEMPYFHVWFGLDGGLGHVVEDERRWPRGDLFAREVVGGMLGCEPDVAKRQGRWGMGDAARVDEWRTRWRRFDWTRALVEEGSLG